jgi:hypothetical protein
MGLWCGIRTRREEIFNHQGEEGAQRIRFEWRIFKTGRARIDKFFGIITLFPCFKQKQP